MEGAGSIFAERLLAELAALLAHDAPLPRAMMAAARPDHGDRRIDREMADLAAVLDKIALLRAAWPSLAKADPKPRYGS